MKLSDLTPDNRNANKGTAKGQKAIVNSIQRSGAGRSIVVDKHGQIIGGNKTAEAIAEVFGAETEVQVIETDGKRLLVHKRTDLDLSDPSPNNPARQLAYADNLTSWASFQLDPAQVMADIEAGFDFEAVDISLPDLGELLGKAADELLAGDNSGQDTEPQIDKAEELRVKWGVEPGQLWQLGDHRLICGDCTDPAVVARVMGGEKAGMMFTDPPFNVGYDYNQYDDNRDDYPEWIKKWVTRYSEIASDDASAFVMNITKNLRLMFAALDNFGSFSNLIVWPRPASETPSNRFTLDWQAIVFYKRGKPVFHAKSQTKETVISDSRGGGINYDGRISDIWADIKPVTAGSRASKEAILNTGKKSKVHPAQMPESLPARAIVFCSDKNDIVYEPFSGSGTTIIACENLGRRCRAIEISPAYVAVSLQRWADHTGKTPELV